MRPSSPPGGTVTPSASSEILARGRPPVARVGRRQWLGSGTLAIAGFALDACAPSDRTLLPQPGATQPSPAAPVHLDLNENPFGPSPQAIAAVRGGLADLARYTAHAGPRGRSLPRVHAGLRTPDVRGSAESTGNFVFFETGRPHEEFAAAMLARGVDIGRAFPPLDRWARISLGLPEDNARARDALRGVIG